MSVVRINAITVPEAGREELERRFAARAGTVDGAAGFEGFQLLRPTGGEDRYFVLTRWADEESFAAWRDGGMQASHAGQGGGEGGSGEGGEGGGQGRPPMAAQAALLEFDVVLDVPPASEASDEPSGEPV